MTHSLLPLASSAGSIEREPRLSKVNMIDNTLPGCFKVLYTLCGAPGYTHVYVITPILFTMSLECRIKPAHCHFVPPMCCGSPFLGHARKPWTKCPETCILKIKPYGYFLAFFVAGPAFPFPARTGCRLAPALAFAVAVVGKRLLEPMAFALCGFGLGVSMGSIKYCKTFTIQYDITYIA